MKKLMRLLALTLAAAMLLSVGALAAENEGSADGPRLVVNWLDWNEEGQCYVRDECLSGDDRGAEELGLAPGDDPHVIFFTIGEDGRRTPVIPQAGKGVTVETVEKENIAPNAKQSSFYVRVRLDGWNDAEVTSGKSSMKIVAQLPDVGFYTTAEAAREGYLRNDQQPFDPSTAADSTVYFISTATDEDNGRHVTDVKKSSNGQTNMYDLEKTGDNVWKITLKIPENGGAWVNLDVAWRDADGNTYTEERGCGFEYPHGPELWKEWLSWDDDPANIHSESDIHGGDIDVTPVPTEYHLAFYTCEEDGEKLTPVPVDQLKADAGVTITPLVPDDAKKSHYAVVSVADWDKDYTISYNGFTMKLKSHLPDFGIYSKPELTTDSFLNDWRFSPTRPNETVYIGSYIPEYDDRVLTDLKLAQFENSDQFTLEKYNDQFYKLTRKALDLPDTGIQFECTWKWSDGHTETWDNEIWMWPYTSGLVSSEQMVVVNNSYDYPAYDTMKGKVSDQLTLKAGEEQTVYLGRTYILEDSWTILPVAPIMMVTSSDALKLTAEDAETCKYTIRCDTPGTYTLSMQGSWADKFFNEKGEDVTDYVNNSEETFYWDYDFKTNKTIVGQGVDEETGTVTDLLEGWSVTLQHEPLEWYPITVTVTGSGTTPATPETPSAFSDVPAASWYAPAVTFANDNGYMKGNPDGTFKPQGKITGSEFSQILYNKEGKPAAADGASFQGVDSQWYAAPILWAAGQGIISDTGDAALVPTADLTRQQIALMLYNYMGKPQGGAELTAFTDASQVSAWALDAVKWAVGEGILKGSNNALNPTGTATRAETAQILMNFFG